LEFIDVGGLLRSIRGRLFLEDAPDGESFSREGENPGPLELDSVTDEGGQEGMKPFRPVVAGGDCGVPRIASSMIASARASRSSLMAWQPWIAKHIGGKDNH
jgi:hypothetical protein